MDCVTLTYSCPLLSNESLRLQQGLPHDTDTNHSGSELHSVLHPTTDKDFRLPSRDFTICFVIPKNPYRAIGSLDFESRKHVLFGLGLASIVVVADEAESVRRIASQLESQTLASETWHVSADNIAKGKPSFHDGDDCLLPDFLLAKDPDISAILSDLHLKLKRLARLSSVFIPSLHGFVQGVHDCIQELVGEISYIEQLGGGVQECPSTIPEPMDAELRNSCHYRQQKLNRNVDMLIQMSSSLSYAISQVFYGCLPSLGNGGFVSYHSFLGVGNAWRGLFNFYQHLIEVFSRCDVSSIIEQDFADYSWIELPEAGPPPEKLLTTSKALARNNLPYPKVVYFSLRHGFGESDASLTAPLQTLNFADSVRWTLMTLTHEMLHAHVKSLIGSVFKAKDQAGRGLTAEKGFEERVRDFQNQMRLKEENGLNRLHTVSFALLQFAVSFVQTGNKELNEELSNTDLTKILFRLKKPATLDEYKEAFRKTYHLASEIMVHALDFHYFYGGDVELFIDSLWETWAKVPGVTEKLDWYVLRTLVAIATISGKDPMTRFSEAKNLLMDRLSKLKMHRSDLTVVETAIDVLKDEQKSRKLCLLFLVGLRLADVTANLLRHRDLQTALSSGDRLLTEVDGEIRYELDDMVFEDAGIENPIAFFRDRLRRASKRDRTCGDDGVMKSTAWAFLVSAGWERHETAR